MVGLGLVLFTLEHYRSPELAGLVVFAGIAPGIAVSPIAGALLDRHGRTRLITLDFLVAAASLALIGALALLGLLPAWLLIAIAALSALTGPLSATGGAPAGTDTAAVATEVALAVRLPRVTVTRTARVLPASAAVAR